MSTTLKSRGWLWVSFCLMAGLSANGRAEVSQILDSVNTHSNTAVLEMQFNDPSRTSDFTNTGILGTSFTTCERTAIDGIFCLDGNLLRHWPDSEDPTQFVDVIDCTDPSLGLDTKKPGACSGMTIESTGAVWFSGRKQGNAYSLFKAVEKSTTAPICPAGFPLTLTDYCVDEVVSDRNELVSLSSIDGDTSANYSNGKGILGLEGNQAVFFQPNGTVIVLASGKQDWNLQGNEALQSVGFLQFARSGVVSNYVLATTTDGRLLATDADTDSGAFQVFDIPDLRGLGAVQCDFNPPAYGVRASSRSELVYVTDRQYCTVSALALQETPAGPFPLEEALTLSTDAGPGETYPPVGPSVAPGVSIDLDDCADECTLVFGEDNSPAAKLSNVQVLGDESNMTLFQITNIPDCRYIPDDCRKLLGKPNLIAEGVIVNLDSLSTANPAAQLLNVTPLLPAEIKDLFADDPLPPMLISRQYRAQHGNAFLFDALFGVTEDGVIFEDTFDGEFFVEALTGSEELGCKSSWPPQTPISSILQWDAVTTVSERVRTFNDPFIGAALPDAGSPEQKQYVDTLTNIGCGSSRTAGTRWSLWPSDLEITPCTFNPDENDVWGSDGSCSVGIYGTADDAVMAKLLLQLYRDLGEALNQLACEDADMAGDAPLSESDCSTLSAQYLNGKDKLDKCWDAAQQPKVSAGSENCQSFAAQLSGFQATLSGVTAEGPDPANRVGELKARVRVLFHVYEDRFLPSIPAGGFSEP